jgi:23S rRNA (cytosine1962-C5)-methyltransferase
MTTFQVTTDHELLDCGDWRRLDRFGPRVLDRPAPAATDPRRLEPAVWAGADGRFERMRDGGRWTWRAGPPEPWPVVVDGLTFELRSAAGGQVGLFPEQRPMWTWIADQVAGATAGTDVPVDVLNLFAFTGGSTLAAARAGASVTHVDGSRGAVAWARRNAELSGLADRPIRWLTDDAEAFVRREIRRGRSYDGVILDPPSYGHGPGGRGWRLADRLGGLLGSVGRLVSERAGFVLLTAHTADLGPDDLRSSLVTVLERRCESGRLELVARSGARLPLGAYARVPRGLR